MVELAWTDTGADSYNVYRATTSGGPYMLKANTTCNIYSDTDVVNGTTYYYVVREVALNEDELCQSNEAQATPEPRTVTVTFNVTVPSSTDGSGRSVYIAGYLAELDGNLPDWDPSGVVLTRVDATLWTITLTGKEETAIEYKYTLGDWDHVEQGAACEELNNRQLTLTYGSNGTQIVNDTVLNWRNVSPCGN
jgi:hypothetical protein